MWKLLTFALLLTLACLGLTTPRTSPRNPSVMAAVPISTPRGLAHPTEAASATPAGHAAAAPAATSKPTRWLAARPATSWTTPPIPSKTRGDRPPRAASVGMVERLGGRSSNPPDARHRTIAATRPAAPSASESPTTPAAPTGNLIERALSIAHAEVGRIDYSRRDADGPHGWRHLREIIAETTGHPPSDAETRRTWKPHGTSWCGVFAIWVYRRAGLDLSWDLNRGRPDGPLEKRWPWDFTRRDEFEDAIQPGDIVVGPGPLWHHSIVVSRGANGALTTISGNTVFGRIVKRASPQLSEVCAVMRPRAR